MQDATTHRERFGAACVGLTPGSKLAVHDRRRYNCSHTRIRLRRRRSFRRSADRGVTQQMAVLAVLRPLDSRSARYANGECVRCRAAVFLPAAVMLAIAACTNMTPPVRPSN